MDYSARVQTVSPSTNPRYYNLIKSFQRRTGCPTVVHLLQRARRAHRLHAAGCYRCFMRTEMDVLVLENQLLLKEEQPAEERDERWMQEFELD